LLHGRIFQGEKLDTKDEFYLSDEMAAWIGLKKSQYLSKLIENMGPDDFGFEEFHTFDHLIPETLANPDKSFEEEIDSYQLKTFVKTYLGNPSFHQVVIGTVFRDEPNKSEVFVPVLVFVTKKEELARPFCTGKVISRPILN